MKNQQAPVIERIGQHLTVRAQILAKGQHTDPGVAVLAEAQARTSPVVSLLVEAEGAGKPIFRTLVHGYGCACAEEMELWEKPGLVLVGIGQAVSILDARTGQLKLRVPMGGYFNALWLADDGRDAFVCGDETVVRLIPPGVVHWTAKVGVDGVLVHRAAAGSVFVSAQRRVGGPWADYILDRLTGNVLEAPDPEEEPEAPKPAAKPQTRKAEAKAADPGEEPEEPADTDVRMVRDDETDPDEG